MASTTDLEVILDQLKSALQTTLNSKIDAIQAEKATGDASAARTVALSHVDNKAYFLQTLDDAIANYDPFILFGLDDPRAQGIGPATAKNYKITVALCASDSGQDLEIARRMFRYSRALEETMEYYFARISPAIKLSVESLAPIQFTLMNSSNNYRAVGVSISVAIA